MKYITARSKRKLSHKKHKARSGLQHISIYDSPSGLLNGLTILTETAANVHDKFLKICLEKGDHYTMSVDELISMTLDGVSIAGYLIGTIFEQAGNLEMAYKMFNALAFENDAHAIRCCADMKMTGRGTEKNQTDAISLYSKAAELGDRAAMFVTGEFLKEKNLRKAAYWYGIAHTRGYEIALNRLCQL